MKPCLRLTLAQQTYEEKYPLERDHFVGVNCREEKNVNIKVTDI
jgi:hypothetical protein